MKKAGEITRNHFVNEAWDYYNWLQGGMLHLTYSEYENQDMKLSEAFNFISSEMQKVKDEEKEMRDLGMGASLNNRPGKMVN